MFINGVTAWIHIRQHWLYQKFLFPLSLVEDGEYLAVHLADVVGLGIYTHLDFKMSKRLSSPEPLRRADTA